MKTRYILFASFAFAVAVFAMPLRWPRYDESKPPSLPLPAAYEKAMASLGQATNQYHCVRASVSNMLVRDGEWDFTFVTSIATNGVPNIKEIGVYFDGTVITNMPTMIL